MTHLHHVGLTVSDLERAVAFWCEGLGCEVAYRQEQAAAYLEQVTGEPGAHTLQAMLAVPGCPVRIELLQYLAPLGTAGSSRPRDPGFAHVAFHCPDVEAAVARLERLGGSPVGPPARVDSGTNAGLTAVYVRDPDGHVIELVSPAAA